MNSLYENNFDNASPAKSRAPQRPGRVIVAFESDGSIRVLPIADSDEQAAALLQAFQVAAQVGDFSDVAQKAGR